MKKKRENYENDNSSNSRQLQGLLEYSQSRSQNTKETVLKAISSLKKQYQKGKIKRLTISLIAREAGVTVATIYNHKELLETIRQISSLRVVSDFSKENKNKNEIFEKRIQKLVDENKELKRVNALLLGNLERKTFEVIELREKIELLKV